MSLSHVGGDLETAVPASGFQAVVELMRVVFGLGRGRKEKGTAEHLAQRGLIPR